MDVRDSKTELQLAKVQHEHSLILIDLQSMHRNYEEDDDEFDDNVLITTQNFVHKCDICGLGIDWYYRYYYKCSQSSCSYSLHKFCKELSPTFQFPGHPIHTLDLKKRLGSWSCDNCLTEHRDGDGVGYRCSTCYYKIDIRCATFMEHTKIYHPGHPHPLMSITLEPTLSKCWSCGEEHKGVFYHCNTCFNFSIHVDCVTLPFKLKSNYHVHMLTLSYSFSIIPYHTKCRICGTRIRKQIWLYKCSKCRYFVHVECATSRREPFLSIFSRGIGRTDPTFKAVDYPNLLYYPLIDESHNMLPQHVLIGNYLRFDKIIFDQGLYIHSSHNHPLRLINAPDTSILIALHDPMMRIKLLCDGCLRPITTTPFYVCDQACNFYLHDWCTRLPREIEKHPGHPKHLLVLFHSPPNDLAKLGFECDICRLCCNGFGYACSRCDYRVDVHCGFIPKRIVHDAHPNHLLEIIPNHFGAICNGCGVYISRRELRFRCVFCDFDLDMRCALHFFKTIRNKCDKHPLNLCYSPIENHKSEYFCEVCEEELIPEAWFYHCKECGQSIHSACGPLILQSEQGANSLNNREGVYKFINMKFGGLIHLPDHEHSFSLFAGTISDSCHACERELQSFVIFKCLTCILAFHVTCVVKGVESFMSHLGVQEKLAYYRYLLRPREDFEDQQTTATLTLDFEEQETAATLTFYPSGVTRAVTGTGKMLMDIPP